MERQSGELCVGGFDHPFLRTFDCCGRAAQCADAGASPGSVNSLFKLPRITGAPASLVHLPVLQ
jgi:hypothetical protein